jgi:hypothetical protein
MRQAWGEVITTTLIDGTRLYFWGVSLHRLGGPAVCYPEGRAIWWIWGHPLDSPAPAPTGRGREERHDHHATGTDSGTCERSELLR